MGRPQGRPRRVRKISPSPRFDPRTAHTVTSCYTDYNPDPPFGPEWFAGVITSHVERKSLLTSCVLTRWRHPFTTLCTLHTAYGFLPTRSVLLHYRFIDSSVTTDSKRVLFFPYFLTTQNNVNGTRWFPAHGTDNGNVQGVSSQVHTSTYSANFYGTGTIDIVLINPPKLAAIQSQFDSIHTFKPDYYYLPPTPGSSILSFLLRIPQTKLLNSFLK